MSVLTIAVVAAGCSNSGKDKAGGNASAKARVLTMAEPGTGLNPRLDTWAAEVRSHSDGTLQVELKDGWRLGDVKFEAGTIADVQAGTVDMAVVGARVFDTVGVNSFQALLAPMLVDSYDLEEAVFKAGIPDQMLAGVEQIGLVGIGVLPGPMRKVLGVSKPFVRPADFAGAVVGTADSAVAEQTLTALGATPRPVRASPTLDGLDGYEQQLASIKGNGYYTSARFVTANVNLWPRPMVIVMNSKTFQSLTSHQRTGIRDATATLPDGIADARTEDAEGVPTLCENGMTLAVASDRDLTDLHAAFQLVYQQLASDPATKNYMDMIRALKEHTAASPDGPACPSTERPPADNGDGIPEGTYETTRTADDYASCPDNQKNTLPVQRFEARFSAGSDTVLEEVNGKMVVGASGTYTIFRDRITFYPPPAMSFRWSFDGKSLTFTDRVGGGCGDSSVMSSHPWVRVP